MQCKQCEAEVPSGVSFCPHCGAPIPEIEPQELEVDSADSSARAATEETPSQLQPAAQAPATQPDPPPPRAETPRERFQQAAASRQGGDDEPERTVWEGSYSGKAMYGYFLIGLVVSVILAVILFKFVDGFGRALLWWVGATLVIEAALYGWLWVRKLSVRYELTTQRLIHQKGLLTRTTDRIELIDIDDVTYRQGPVERVLAVGTIMITSSDRTHPELLMPGIDPVREMAGKIDDLRRSERRRRGLHIESI